MHLKALVVFTCLFPLYLFPQRANPDSLLNAARQLAYKNQYTQALSIGRKLCADYPDNLEYRIFTARVDAWNHSFEESRQLLAPYKNNGNSEVLDVLSDVELWDGNGENALKYINEALAKEPSSSLFLLKKAKAEASLERTGEAIETLNTLLKLDPANKEAIQLLEELKEKNRKNRISASYLNNSFSNPASSSWHFGYLEYTRYFDECPLIARTNFGAVNGNNAFQLEADAYPKLGKGRYAFLNAGYSPGQDIFPAWKAGAEIFQKIARPLEISLGARYMNFTSEDVFIYTGYIGLYPKNWWLAYRAYLVTQNSNLYFTHTLSARRYLKDENNYFTVYAIYGAAPYFYSFLQDFTRVNAQRAGIDFQFSIKKSWYIRPLIMYEYEEYYPGNFRNRVDAQLTLSKKF